MARTARNLIFPRGCAGCDAPDEILCPHCAAAFSYCRLRDLGPRGDGGVRLPAWSAATYQGVARHAILEWKDHDDVELDRVFASIMASLVERCGIAGQLTDESQPVMVVPAPSSLTSMRRRGRWHTLPLARAVANALQAQSIEVSVSTALESHTEGGKSVQQISSAQRAQRIGGNIRVTSPSAYRGSTVILVDDIITTGSTLRQCAQALRQSGAYVLGALALAEVVVQQPLES